MMTDELSATFAALADPTRRAILARLATSEATVNELAEPFAISLQAISKHLKVLEGAGLITRGREGQFRPCRLEAAPLQTAAEWIEGQRAIWNDRFDQLEKHLRQLQQRQRRAAGEDPLNGAPAAANPPAANPPAKKGRKP
ncbi:ArsR/SmtB family transcription factor [Jatrophihabitans sp. DSM 45814]